MNTTTESDAPPFDPMTILEDDPAFAAGLRTVIHRINQGKLPETSFGRFRRKLARSVLRRYFDPSIVKGLAV